MLCSNPLPTKANRHQKIKTSFAASLVVRPAVQTARQTSQLHRIPRTISSHPDRFIFVAATFMSRSTCGACESTPDWATSQASPSEPARFPASETAKIHVSVPQEISRVSAPTAQTMLFPVNSSDPAKMTRARAIPKAAPITSLEAGEPAAANGAPILQIRGNAKPRYTPGTAERVGEAAGM